MAHKYDGFARYYGFLNWNDAAVRVKKAKLWVHAHPGEWPPPHNLRMAAELHYSIVKYENAPWRVYGRAIRRLWWYLRDKAALSPRFRASFPVAYYNTAQIVEYLDRHTLPADKKALAACPLHDIEQLVSERVVKYNRMFGLSEPNNPHNDKAVHRTVCAIINHCWLNWH